ncbi:flagella basal body P-ring formation protein FlgA [Meridianimarinicoccus roseus]|uniref:Flagella basal body P-ring formation protein FlgA n=1 Tax=Meridianimarinicoccus roseus TaxID=2072018 RepID=A0A2V2LMC6_9RHOB|nr:flagellar basal body P-ring formation chaperone FlgA [Meridianimarinicoccus roseus]PWR04366.1 flagella basal body P-ring formation protein FlgA [Meridianimarinicoccus roseus]
MDLRRPLALALSLLPVLSPAAAADTLIALRNLRSETVVTAVDLGRADTATPGALRDPSAAIGMETRVTIYAGRPIMAQDLGPPALVERNQIVVLNYHHAGLAIVTEGRALDRGGAGDRIRVMNLTSRNTVTGSVARDGSVTVAP